MLGGWAGSPRGSCEPSRGWSPHTLAKGAAPLEWELWVLEPEDKDLPTGLGTGGKEQNMTQILP